MKTYISALLWVCLLMGLSAKNVPAKAVPVEDAAVEEEYILLKDDSVALTVYQEPELSKQETISKSGYVSLPLIGSVKLAGLNLLEAEKEIERLYADGYLIKPRVNLSIVSYSDRYVIVGGAVNGPGVIRYPEDGALDLRAALAQAGGVSDDANKSEIYVRERGVDGKVKRYSFNSAANKIMKHGDMITVGRSSLDESSITLTGQIGNPGTMALPKEGKLGIVTAIANAGGLGRIANKKEVIVRRDGKQFLVSLKNINTGKAPMFYMQAGDILFVKESRF